MITEAAAIDLVVTAILKSASSEVVKKGIASISDRLTKAFESQSHEQIVKVVEEDNLIEPLSSLAQVSLNNSVVIGISESLAKPEQKAQLFESVLRACFAASKKTNLTFGSLGHLQGRNTCRYFVQVTKFLR